MEVEATGLEAPAAQMLPKNSKLWIKLKPSSCRSSPGIIAKNVRQMLQKMHIQAWNQLR